MKKEDLTGLSIADLVGQIKENKFKLTKLKLNHKVSDIENPMQIRQMRRLVARLSTELTSRNQK